ncbi:MAG TPA: hypothetical protein VHC69_25785 [Polyangiaceae bacterium]|nr:hypothetical protein [Polyangiaceae bacterium]
MVRPRVLLVDENHLLTKSLARCFARLGCSATVAFNCSDAAASPGPFDCGVFDVEVGATDGVAFAERLRRAGTIATATFYCTSSNGRLLRRASAIGPVVFKDAPMSQLMQAVRAQIEVARSGRIGRGG